MIHCGINNEFQYKTFLNELGDNPTLDDFIAIKKKFGSLERNVSCVSSYFYLIKAANDLLKYHKSESFDNFLISSLRIFADNTIHISSYKYKADVYNFFNKNPEAINTLKNSIQFVESDFESEFLVNFIAAYSIKN